MRGVASIAIHAVLGTLPLGLLVTGAATAAERVIMPYACGFEGNRLVVRPSESRAYGVLDPRAQQPFTTCQPGGDRCTTLMVHRFSILCDGVRVPWVRVAAAIAPRRFGRQWIESGRLTIVRPAPGGRGQARVCADPRSRQGDRDCLPWNPAPPMERIQLPVGFAPLGDAGAGIETIAGTETNTSSAVAAPRADVEPAGSAANSAGNNAARVPAPPAAAVLAPRGMAVGAPQVTAKRADWVTVIEARDLSSAPVTTPARNTILWAWFGGLAAFGLIALGLAQVPAERRASFAAAMRQRAARGRVAVTARIAALRAPAPAAAADEAASGAADDPALANAAWAAATLLDQIEQAVQGLGRSTPLREVLEQELASIQQRLVMTRATALDGGEPAKAAAQFRALIRELERVRRIADSAAASLSAVRPELAMPKTKSEAYQLLGVNADVSDGILKKLVDALRMTWHPDHARDEPDRLLREDRIKQINIAWELIR